MRSFFVLALGIDAAGGKVGVSERRLLLKPSGSVAGPAHPRRASLLSIQGRPVLAVGEQVIVDLALRAGIVEVLAARNSWLSLSGSVTLGRSLVFASGGY